MPSIRLKMHASRTERTLDNARLGFRKVFQSVSRFELYENAHDVGDGDEGERVLLYN